MAPSQPTMSPADNHTPPVGQAVLPEVAPGGKEDFARLTRLAAALLQAPVALVVLRRDGVDEIANPAEDRSDDGRDAPDPVHPPDLICTVSHRFHHYPHIDSATIYEEMSSPWERG